MVPLVLYDDGRPAVRLRGINRADAAKLRLSLRVLALTPEIADALSWRDAVTAAVDSALADHRWLPTEVIDDLERRRPASGLAERIREAGAETAISAEEVEAAAFVGVDLEGLATHTNDRVMESELVSRRPFFDSIEKTPLTRRARTRRGLLRQPRAGAGRCRLRQDVRDGRPSCVRREPRLRRPGSDPSARFQQERSEGDAGEDRSSVRGVVLITPAQRMSPFVIELLQDPNVLVDGAAVEQVEVCVTCKQGVMVERRSRFGPFLSCSRFPASTNKRNIPRPARWAEPSKSFSRPAREP